MKPQVWVKARSKNGQRVVRFTTCPKHKGKETLSVKACCTAPSLNPNMKPQKNKARPKRPQFFLPGLLKVALFPGHWRAWNRRRIDPPFSVSGDPGISRRPHHPLLRVGLYLAGQRLAWPGHARFGCEQPVTQDLHFFRSERLYISGWLTSPVVLADKATAAIWSQGMSGCK